MELKNKVALITGGTHGIGAETALRLAGKGAKISVVARNTDNAIKTKIEDMGSQCIMLSADLVKPEECTRVAEETIQQLGSIDILVHAAGSAAARRISPSSPG